VSYASFFQPGWQLMGAGPDGGFTPGESGEGLVLDPTACSL
jgi:hypothetical protein